MTLKRKIEPYPHWEFRDTKNNNSLKIVPERGGLITSWIYQGKEIIYLDVDRFHQKDKSVRGGIPILFPICGDLPGGCLKLPQGNFVLSQHGFARDLPWSIQAMKDESGFLLTLSDNEQTNKFFPFSFFIEIQVKLNENSLALKTFIRNSGNQLLPFSFGFHPYFKVTNLNDVSISGLPEKCIDHLTMNETSTSNQLRMLSKGVDFLSRIHGSIFLNDSLGRRSIELQHDSPLDLGVVWTDPPRQMVCLEPWTSPRQSLITRDRMLLLEPGVSQELNCRFLVHST